MLFSRTESDALLGAEASAMPLGALTRCGEVGAAVARIEGRPVAEVVDVMMRAGFSIVVPPRVDFMSYMRAQLREASRLRLDGFGLRQMKVQRLEQRPG